MGKHAANSFKTGLGSSARGSVTGMYFFTTPSVNAVVYENAQMIQGLPGTFHQEPWPFSFNFHSRLVCGDTRSELSRTNRQTIQKCNLRDPMGSRLSAQSLRGYKHQQEFTSILGDQALLKARDRNTKGLSLSSRLQGFGEIRLITRIRHRDRHIFAGCQFGGGMLLNRIDKGNGLKAQMRGS